MLKQYVKKLKLEKFISLLNQKNIGARPIWFPLHMQVPYKKYQSSKIINATKIYKTTFNIPSSTNLSIKDAYLVVKTIIKTIKRFY